MLAFQNFGKAADGLRNWHIFARQTGKLSSYKERLRQETLYFTRSGYNQLILFGKLVHTEDRNDILQLFILLQNLLYASGYTIMLLTDDSGIQNAGGRLQRINRRINT